MTDPTPLVSHRLLWFPCVAWLCVLHLAWPDPNIERESKDSQVLSTNHDNKPSHGQLQGLCGVLQHTVIAATTRDPFVVYHVSHPSLHYDFYVPPPFNFPTAFEIAVWLVSAYQGMLHIGTYWSPLLHPGCWPHTLVVFSYFTPVEAP